MDLTVWSDYLFPIGIISLKFLYLSYIFKAFSNSTYQSRLWIKLLRIITIVYLFIVVALNLILFYTISVCQGCAIIVVAGFAAFVELIFFTALALTLWPYFNSLQKTICRLPPS